MTVSILALDEESGTLGGAAATGSLCVGGWVLRGDVRAGLSASQGTAPSTFWGEDSVAAMRAGESAPAAVRRLTSADPGRAHRQLAALDLAGRTGHFTGADSIPFASAAAARHVVVAGNMLAGPEVIDAALAAMTGSMGAMSERLLAALDAAAASGGDSRGLLSAALLVLAPDAPPLTLRIDWSETPLADLRALYARSQAQPYRGWMAVVPTLRDPFRSVAPVTGGD